MEYKFLSEINSPEDVKKIDSKDLPLLCTEIREFLIENAKKQGGHLASNLGVVELTVALHRIFDSPSDHIIFDVGHQSYVHKILTGRKDRFDTLRRPGGLSGFTVMSESDHDPFGAGHSSTSVSAALGFAKADKLSGNDAYTVAVLGDGAYTGGMVHEALNNCDPSLRLIIILNENGMSISVNKGSFASYLSDVRASGSYLKFKSNTKSFLSHIPLIGKPLHRFFSFLRNRFKSMFFSSNYFEDLGLYYIGPIDGNNTKKLEAALTKAKKLDKCVVVHVKTQKGRGYTPAEESPDDFHSISSNTKTQDSFHSVFTNKLIEKAENDEKICAVTAAMGIGTGLSQFGEHYPERYFDVGIAEGHALTFSAGLAAAGCKPFAGIYSTFLQRGYDSIVHDICLQNLPVRMFVDRAGLAISDGPTHHGIFDVAFLSHIPNMRILSPATYSALEYALDVAVESDTPIAVRYPNLSESRLVRDTFYPDGKCEDLEIRTSFDKESCPEYLFITYGTIAEKVLEAADALRRENMDVGVILLEELKPYRRVAEQVAKYVDKAKKIVFAEEGIKYGGAGMLLSEELTSLGIALDDKYKIAAINDNFAIAEDASDLYEQLGIGTDSLAELMKKEKI